MKHPLQKMMDRRQQGENCGIPSYCSANELVLEQILKRAKSLNQPTLIEATANQVNQFGGYTGMLPKDFFHKVIHMAEEIGLPKDKVILAGDHLGPLTWQHLTEKEAMSNAAQLVYEYARAGFSKLHLDTSMKLSDDPQGILSTRTIALRGAALYKEAMRGYEDLRAEDPQALRPVFIIGSEVPIPGGTTKEEETLTVTHPQALRDTLSTYQQVFEEEGIGNGMQDVIAVVVQPGVEFGDEQIFAYNREAAADLCHALKDYPGVCFEGHSSDYQSADGLRQMVQDGIAILKVGPALTYGLRESLFALSLMEKELVPTEKQAHFIEILDKVMLEDPSNWKNHYHGSDHQTALSRKYSFSDRARYYMGNPEVKAAIDQLFHNLRLFPLPINMLHQYMPLSYQRVRDGLIPLDPRSLALDGVQNILTDYEYAAGLSCCRPERKSFISS